MKSRRKSEVLGRIPGNTEFGKYNQPATFFPGGLSGVNNTCGVALNIANRLIQLRQGNEKQVRFVNHRTNNELE